jgi:uncharacterized protein DUF992
MIRLSIAALATALIASTSAAIAQDRVEAGMLECRGTTTSFVVGSVTELNCTFRGADGAPLENYMGRMKRVGLDIGVGQQVGVAWGVFAPTRLRRGELAGTYAGGAASATVGVGVGANALFGGSNNTVSLQPVSLQGQTGLSAAAGIASLELRPVGP